MGKPSLWQRDRDSGPQLDLRATQAQTQHPRTPSPPKFKEENQPPPPCRNPRLLEQTPASVCSLSRPTFRAQHLCLSPGTPRHTHRCARRGTSQDLHSTKACKAKGPLPPAGVQKHTLHQRQGVRILPSLSESPVCCPPRSSANGEAQAGRHVWFSPFPLSRSILQTYPIHPVTKNEIICHLHHR